MVRPGTKRAKASLARALAYRHDDVVARFRQEYPVSQAAAEDVWAQAKTWIWLAGNADVDQPFDMSEATQVIDQMWHTFVLFTRDYAAFCEACCGRFVHHTPRSSASRTAADARLAADPDGEVAAIRAAKRVQYEAVARYLGEATLRKWYVEYPRRYSPAVLRRLRSASLKAESQPRRPR
jgi:hypothetical protein